MNLICVTLSYTQDLETWADVVTSSKLQQMHQQLLWWCISTRKYFFLDIKLTKQISYHRCTCLEFFFTSQAFMAICLWSQYVSHLEPREAWLYFVEIVNLLDSNLLFVAVPLPPYMTTTYRLWGPGRWATCIVLLVVYLNRLSVQFVFTHLPGISGKTLPGRFRGGLLDNAACFYACLCWDSCTMNKLSYKKKLRHDNSHLRVHKA